LMTDGHPTDYIESAVDRVRQLASQKKLTVFAVAIGDRADINALKKFSTMKNNMVLKVKSAQYFREFFEWLSQSVSVASQSVPGEKASLPKTPTSIEIEL